MDGFMPASPAADLPPGAAFGTAPLPARAFLGTNALLNGSRFEVMGIAAKP